MKNKEILKFRESLNEVDYIRGKMFAYTVLKNKEALDKELEIINKLKKEPHPEYFNFENERTLLCHSHADKDEQGNPVLRYNPNGSQSFQITNMENFQIEFEELSKKYSDVLNDVKNAEIEYNDFLEKENDIELKKVKFEDLPNDINVSMLEKIKYMID